MTKAKRPDIERALDRPDGAVRLYLLHGPDAAGSRALISRLLAALGPGTERIAVAPAALKSNPALLADEAASLSLFGDHRLILVEGAGDESLDAVQALLASPTSGNPVAMTSGVLKKTSKLLALIEAAPAALAFASSVPEGRDAERLVIDLARNAGLTLAPDVARRLAEAGAGDRALIALELDKFALYLDAAPDRPATLDHVVVDALSAGNEECDVSRAVDAVLDGETAAVDRELGQLEPIVVVRALGRRILLLGRLRAEVEHGNGVEAAMASHGRSVFYKDKPAVTRQLGRWSSRRLATAMSRILAAERDLKAQGSLGREAVTEPLFAIAQAVSRRR